MHLAAANGDAETTIALIKAGADVHSKECTEGYRLRVSFSAMSNSQRAWLGLAWLGLAWLGLAWLGLAWLGLAWLGLESDWLCRWTALHLASGIVHPETATALGRWTALHNVSHEKHTETAKVLLVAGADLHCKDNQGYGRWHWLGNRMTVTWACAVQKDGTALRIT